MSVENLKQEYLKSVNQTDIIRFVFSFCICIVWWLWQNDICFKLLLILIYEATNLRLMHLYHIQCWNSWLITYNQAMIVNNQVAATGSVDSLPDKFKPADISIIGAPDEGVWHIHVFSLIIKYTLSFIICRIAVGAGFYDDFFNFLFGYSSRIWVYFVSIRETIGILFLSGLCLFAIAFLVGSLKREK